MQKWLRVLLVVTFLASFVAMPVMANQGPNTDQPTNNASVDRSRALVQLKGDPLSTYEKTKPPQGKKIDFDQSTVKSYRAQLSALRKNFKSWLRANAPKARVTGEFDVSLNAVAIELNGEDLTKIASAPMVVSAEYEGLYSPTQDETTDPDLALISAVSAWDQSNGDATAGAGIKVAIVDSGIDVAHLCFDDASYPDVDQLGDTRFTNNKVIAAKVFNNKTPSRHYTPEAIDSHGTHVAGTVACNYNTPVVVDGVSIPHGISGVAPRALLGNYNVFPSDVANARSEDILNALEAAYADGFDVANMSLGGGSHGTQDLLTIAVDNLDEANMVVAVAVGNSGPGYNTVESPGMAERALTAGASTVPHFVAAPVTVDGDTYGAAAGDFPTVDTDLTAPLSVVTGNSNGLSTACSPLSVDLTGTIALISRGTCTFSAKILNAENAGAVAVLVANNVAGDPTAMASDGTPDQPTVPAYMVALSTGQTLLDKDGSSATIGADKQYLVTANGDIMAGFSSQGPTDVKFRVKPDVVAPGVNVLSSIPAAYCEEPPCFAFFSGTSMATPHLAGSAAVVRQQHPDWTAAQVRSAIVNTADQGVLKDYQQANPVSDVNIIGAGRENLLSAVQAQVALDPVSISFGAIPSGSGQTQTFDLALSNLSASALTLNLAIEADDASIAYNVSSSTVTLDSNELITVTITMSANKGASTGPHQAWLRITSQDFEIAHAAVYTLIK